MFQTIRNAWRIPELRSRLLFTILIIMLYRFGAQVPVPYVDAGALGQWFSTQGDTIFGYMNILSGEAFSQATLFALSISPYITASIVMQLLTIAIPALERMQKEGEDGKKKITQITRYVTILLGVITGYGYYLVCRNMGLITYPDNVFVAIVIIACYSAGSALVMWLGERINEKGIGNGISIILFFNIISSLPGYVVTSITRIIQSPITIIEVLVIAVVALVLVAMVIYVTNAERRLPVQYAKRVVGRKMYGGQSTHLPMKVNMSGVMPIIFASSIVSLPTMIISFINSNPEQGTFLYGLSSFFSTRSAAYPIAMFVLIILFAYFYIAISFNPVEVANNLKKNGGSITGIRPGKPTSDYIARILNKLTLIGGLFLGFIAVFPFVINGIMLLITNSSLGGIAFGGSSIIIVVGVVLDTTKEVEAQMTMRHYKGFLE